VVIKSATSSSALRLEPLVAVEGATRRRVTAVVHAIVLIVAEPARIGALASDIADLDGVSAAYSVAGDEDIVVVIRVSDHESLADLVTGSIAAQPGVLRTRTLIAFRVYSQADLESI
jgi:DNA-binding Lrp family transcriptional regulator